VTRDNEGRPAYVDTHEAAQAFGVLVGRPWETWGPPDGDDQNLWIAGGIVAAIVRAYALGDRERLLKLNEIAYPRHARTAAFMSNVEHAQALFHGLADYSEGRAVESLRDLAKHHPVAAPPYLSWKPLEALAIFHLTRAHEGLWDLSPAKLEKIHRFMQRADPRRTKGAGHWTTARVAGAIALEVGILGAEKKAGEDEDSAQSRIALMLAKRAR
jgi:hypothetical protein